MQLLNGHLRISFGNGWGRSGREAYAGGAHDASARDCRSDLFDIIGAPVGRPITPGPGDRSR